MQMVDGIRDRAWIYRLIYVGLALVIIFLQLVPLRNQPGRLPGPDLLLTLTLAWVMRRPDYLPAGLVGLVVLMQDMILMRPPGLWAALMVLACEFLRSRAALTRELSFVMEWLVVSVVMLGMLLTYQLVCAVAFVPQPAFGLALVQVLWSALIFPLVIFASRAGLGLHKPAMGEVDDRGRRL
jgi:rod shape-determining protein MreD